MSNLQILSTFSIGGQELSNRLVLAPMTRARCTPTEDPFDEVNQIPNDLLVEYYAQRASAGLLITEATGISEEGSGWLNAPRIYTSTHVAGWKKVVDRVHEKNGKIYAQLWHMGRQSHSSFHPSTNRTVSASAIPMTGTVKTIQGENVEGEVPHPLTIDEIQSTIQDFVHAAKLAKEAGFDGVEVHAANGYLLDQFLQSSSNQRTDAYGGSPEKRLRIVKEIIESIVESGSFPENRIGVRISPNGSFGGMGSEDNHAMFSFVAKELNRYNLAFVHIMDGLGFGYHEKDKVVTAMDIRKHFDGPIIANVGLTKEIAEGMVRSGATDMVAFGRPYISNPDLVERFQNDWPLAADAEYNDWWGANGAKGYTDFPAYQPEPSATE